jgi:Zinc carboxypeptidase.
MGVDLNRNYDFHWNSNLGSSPNECNEEYRGPKPFSEPETQAIKGFVEDNLSKIKLAINFHA